MNIVIEMPAGTKDKIEIKDGKPVVDRTLSIACPINYGYIEGTLSPDGDPLDTFLIGPALEPTSVVQDYKVLGYFECEDNGHSDDKVVAYTGAHPYDSWYTILEIDHYLRNYKLGFNVVSWHADSSAAEKLIVDSKVG